VKRRFPYETKVADRLWRTAAFRRSDILSRRVFTTAPHWGGGPFGDANAATLAGPPGGPVGTKTPSRENRLRSWPARKASTGPDAEDVASSCRSPLEAIHSQTAFLGPPRQMPSRLRRPGEPPPHHVSPSTTDHGRRGRIPAYVGSNPMLPPVSHRSPEEWRFFLPRPGRPGFTMVTVNVAGLDTLSAQMHEAPPRRKGQMIGCRTPSRGCTGLGVGR